MIVIPAHQPIKRRPSITGFQIRRAGKQETFTGMMLSAMPETHNVLKKRLLNNKPKRLKPLTQ